MLANGGEEERNGARDTEGPPVSGETKLAANGNTFELMADNSTSRVLEYLQEAREEGNGEGDGPNFHWFKMRSNGPDQELDLPHTPAGETSPAASLSTPDDTPSIQVGARPRGRPMVANLRVFIGFRSILTGQ